MSDTMREDGGLSRKPLRLQLTTRRHTQLAETAAELGLGPEQLAQVWLSQQIDQVVADRALASGRDRLQRDQLLDSRDGSPVVPVHPQARPRTSLHQEILDVLHASDKPMSVSEIASEIRRRGAYLPPRSTQEISAAVVSRRLSNPQYSPLFERDGRKVSPAKTET